MTTSATVNVSEFLDEQKVSPLQILVMVLCFLAVLLEGLNAQVVGYLAPTFAVSLHLSHQVMGLVFSSGLAGVVVGTLFFGSLADRVGRRRGLIASSLIMGIFSAATAFSNSAGSLIVLRFLTGLGIGGVAPNTISLLTEFSPKRIRGTMLMAMFAGFPIGAMLAGFGAAPLVPAYGWRAVFGLFGALPLILVGVLIFALPESIHHLVLEGGKSRQISALLSRINPRLEFSSETNFILGEERTARAVVGNLFRQRRAWPTILLWVVFFTSLLDIYLLTSWLPTVFHGAGMTLSFSIVAAALFPAGAAGCSVVLGRAVDRFGAYRVLVLTYLGGAVSVALLGLAHSAAGVMILTFCAGVGIMGSQMGAMFLAASIYPTSIRSTGVGWALGVGRIGSIVGPVLGGLMLAGLWPLSTIFLVSAAPAIVGSAAVYLMGRAKSATDAAGRAKPLLVSSRGDRGST